MSTPIGSIEFLVKFDTMSQSFKDALKDAISDATTGGEGEDGETTLDKIARDLAWVKYNIYERVRGSFGETFESFGMAATPEINWLLDEKTVEKATKKFIVTPTAATFFPKGKKETDEDYEERIYEMFRKAFLIQADEIGKAAVDRIYWKMNRAHIETMEDAVKAAMLGTWQNLFKEFLVQTIRENEMKEQLYKMIIEAKGALGTMPLGTSEKMRYQAAVKIGKGPEELTAEKLEEWFLSFGEKVGTDILTTTTKIKDETARKKIQEELFGPEAKYFIPAQSVYIPSALLKTIEDMIKTMTVTTIGEGPKELSKEDYEKLLDTFKPEEKKKLESQRGMVTEGEAREKLEETFFGESAQFYLPVESPFASTAFRRTLADIAEALGLEAQPTIIDESKAGVQKPGRLYRRFSEGETMKWDALIKLIREEQINALEKFIKERALDPEAFEGLFKNLRESLKKYGWTTLLVELGKIVGLTKYLEKGPAGKLNMYNVMLAGVGMTKGEVPVPNLTSPDLIRNIEKSDLDIITKEDLLLKNIEELIIIANQSKKSVNVIRDIVSSKEEISDAMATKLNQLKEAGIDILKTSNES